MLLAVGPATRLIQFLQRYPKYYRTQFRFGVRSDTDDIWGSVEHVDPFVEPTVEALRTAIAAQVGRISQRPPSYSALKIAGRRAYELARQGHQIELAERAVEIHSIDLWSFEFPFAELSICCSSGTYIRSIARDIGEALGCGGVMSRLRRTAIGPFSERDAIELESLEQMQFDALIPPHQAFPKMPSVKLDSAQFAALKYGRPIEISNLAEHFELMALTCDGEFAAWLIRKDRTDRGTALYRAIVNWAPRLQH